MSQFDEKLKDQRTRLDTLGSQIGSLDMKMNDINIMLSNVSAPV